MSLPVFMAPESLTAKFTLSLAPPGGGAGGGTGNIIAGFPFVRQALPNWCWAAVASGVDAVRGSKRSQCQIAEQYGISTQWPELAVALAAPCCPPSMRSDTVGYLNEVLDMLNLSASTYSEIQSGDATATEARTEVGAKRPFPIRISWSEAGDGHFIAIIGTTQQQEFLVYDPSERHEDVNHLLTVTERGLAKGYDGIGRWSHVYPVQ